MPEISISDQVVCAKRELRMRHRVYPSWVRIGRITPDQAAHELAAMAAIVATLTRLRAAEQPDLLANIDNA